jgi:hypothetical protein
MNVKIGTETPIVFWENLFQNFGIPSFWLKYFSMPKSSRLVEMTYCLRRRDQDEVGGDVNARRVDDKRVGGNAGNGGANLGRKHIAAMSSSL